MAGCTNQKEIAEQIESLLLEGPMAIGCPNTKYNAWETSEYILPYPVGKTYTVNLAHCGGSYHSEGMPDQYAIDFDMLIGEQVTAARSGTVIYVEESGTDGGFPNNLVGIEHSDGTIAYYMHLTKGGALVEVGFSVAQGDIIGLSGNTGLAGYAHLHFVVTEPPGTWPYVSIPTTFRNTLSNERSLAFGIKYTAYPFE